MISVPLWVWLVLGFSTLAALTSAAGYVFFDSIPFKIYAPTVGMLLGSVACIGVFLFVRSDIQVIELSLLLLAGVFASIGSIVRYRWKHGGKERYERIRGELIDKRHERIEARNKKSR